MTFEQSRRRYAVVLLVGLLAGAPYGRAINRNAPDHIVRAWRLAHGTLPLAALVGERGLTPRPPRSNQLVYLGNMLGVATSLIGAIGLLYAAYLSLHG